MTIDIVTARRGTVVSRLGRAGASGLLPIYGTTLFVSALLVFSVQPMFAKMVLPRLGGSSGVWNTAMVFFQAALLAGYAYAHATTRLFQPRIQVLLHGAILLVAVVVLPVGMAAGWTAPGEHDPILWLLGLMAASVGLPFFAIAATAPLMQRWFAYSEHNAASDPYFLYGSSNLGSLLALLGYPLVIEPLLKLEEQSWAWTWGYGLLLLLIAGCSLPLWRHGLRAVVEVLPRHAADRAEPIAWTRRLHWMLLAFAPSSLLLGVTTQITADVAAAPFLWVIPLALYLATFVLVFARRPVLKHLWVVRAQPVILVPFAIILAFEITAWWFSLALYLSVFFVTAMVCHGELAKRRPGTSHLTEFYLWMSIGGVGSRTGSISRSPSGCAASLSCRRSASTPMCPQTAPSSPISPMSWRESSSMPSRIGRCASASVSRPLPWRCKRSRYRRTRWHGSAASTAFTRCQVNATASSRCCAMARRCTGRSIPTQHSVASR
jgi:hypothetical protein